MTSGATPMPSTTMSAGSSRPPSVTTLRDAPVALEPPERVVGDPVDPVLAQHAGEELARRARRSRVDSGAVLLHDQRAALALGGQRRGDLAGDVGAADRARCARRPRRRRGSRRSCRACAGSGCRRGRSRRRAARLTLAPVASTACSNTARRRWTAWPSSPPGRASSRSCGCAGRARPGSVAGRCPRASSCRAGSPWSSTGARTAGRRRGRRAAPSRRSRRSRSASAHAEPAPPAPTIRTSTSAIAPVRPRTRA